MKKPVKHRQPQPRDVESSCSHISAQPKSPQTRTLPLLRPVCLSSGPKPHLHLKVTTRRGTFQPSRAAFLAARGSLQGLTDFSAHCLVRGKGAFPGWDFITIFQGRIRHWGRAFTSAFVSKERILGLTVLRKVQTQEPVLTQTRDKSLG